MSKVNVKFLTLMAVVMILPLTAVAMADTVGEAYASNTGGGTISDPYTRVDCTASDLHDMWINVKTIYILKGSEITIVDDTVDDADYSAFLVSGSGLSRSGGKLIGIMDGDCTVEFNIIIPEVGEEDTIRMTFVSVPNAYSITYNANGGTAVNPTVVNAGSSTYLPSTARSGYLFDGWYTAATGGTLIGKAGDSYTPSGNVTIYAQWTVATATISSSPSTLDTYTGQHWSYTVSALPSDATITVSGASWLSVSVRSYQAQSELRVITL